MSTSSSSNYLTLGNYNVSSNVSRDLLVGQQSTTVKPQWGAVGNDILSHGQKQSSCNGYFNVNNAYGGMSNPCNNK